MDATDVPQVNLTPEAVEAGDDVPAVLPIRALTRASRQLVGALVVMEWPHPLSAVLQLLTVSRLGCRKAFWNLCLLSRRPSFRQRWMWYRLLMLWWLSRRRIKWLDSLSTMCRLNLKYRTHNACAHQSTQRRW